MKFCTQKSESFSTLP